MVSENGLPVLEIMRPEIAKVNKTDTADKIARLMRRNNSSAVFVFDKDAPVGVITERDLTRKIVAENLEPVKIDAGKIMSSPVIFVSPKDNINDAAMMMIKNNVKRLPVMENGKVIGVVSAKDLLNLGSSLTEILNEYKKLNENGSMPLVPSKEGVRGNCEICDNYSGALTEVNGQWACPICLREMVD